MSFGPGHATVAGGYGAMEAALAAAAGGRVPRAETADLFDGRGDLHLGMKGRDQLDCTHYCYAPYLVAPLVDRVARALLAPPAA